MRFIVALSIMAVAALAQAQELRVALLLSADGRHHDEFDAALKSLGWSADRYPCKAEKMKTLAGKLGDYDMLIAAPLFNYGHEPLLPKDDRAPFRQFVEQGGLIAVTDGSYPGVRAWLADIDPALGGLEVGKCNSSQWAVNGVTSDADPPHPLRRFPARINEPNSWPHFLAPPKDSAWRQVAACSEGHPVTFAQSIGKGLVSLSALRQPSAKQLGNFYACLQLSRAGIALQAFEISPPAIGDGTIRLQFADGGAKEQCAFAYEVVGSDGRTERFEKAVAGDTFELPYRIGQRGPVTTRLLFKRGDTEAVLFAQSAVIPPLLTVKPNAYRGILSAARRLPTVGFGVELAPDDEPLAGATVELTVVDARGEPIAAASTTLADDRQALSYRQDVTLDRALPAGDYVVRATLVSGAKTLAKADAKFKIVAPQPAQTIVDEDRTLLVGGKPFFPVGLYHVNPTDYAEVTALGINTVQYWTWHGPAGLDLAAKHKLKVVFELNHKSEQIVRDVVADYGKREEILMWYGLDEPAEGSYGMAELLRTTFHACDEQHPVYTVSCRPDVFAEQAQFADVFAHDPYGKPQKALDWMLKADAAVARRKPIICVPGVFGEETPEELRATTYIALTSDARGILWYPWRQAGGGQLGIGLKNSPEQQAVVKQLCTEIRALQPALTTPVRHPFSSHDGKLRGLYCAPLPQRFLLLVNTTARPLETEAEIAGGQDLTQDFDEFFQKRSKPLAVKSGKFRIALAPYETCVYRCD